MRPDYNNSQGSPIMGLVWIIFSVAVVAYMVFK